MLLNEEAMVMETPAGETVEKRIFHDNEGKEISCSEFCRLKFQENMSKREIADTYDINYRTVYGACQNMTNEAAPEKRGRAASNATIKVDAEGNVYVPTADGILVNGELADVNLDEIEVSEVSRKEWIETQFSAGMDRGNIAKVLNLSHGVIYNATKALGNGSRARVMITLEDGSQVERTAYIRQLVAEGHERKDVAKLLGVEYNVVYQATKVVKTLEEKFATAVEVVAKYADKVENVEEFEILIEALKGITFKVETAETSEVVEETIAE